MRIFSLLFCLIVIHCCKAQNVFKGALRNGDLLFQNLDCGSLCDAIEQVTQSYGGRRFSHIGLVEVTTKHVWIIEAIGENVKRTSLTDFLQRSNNEVMLGRLKSTYQNIVPKAMQFAIKQIGTPYDDVFLYNNGRYYCSELIYDAFKFANNKKDVFKLAPMTFKNPGSNNYFDAWTDYYKNLNTDIPEGKPGINPGGISLSPFLNMYVYKQSSNLQKKWKLVWNDEFNYTGLPDSSKWGYDLGSWEGWGNNELQFYTRNSKNARVENGNLIIEAHKEKADAFNYTSARLITKGKASWQYGKIEVRAKIPAGRGSWPAIWMLADNIKRWPDDGEIDIMEHVGYDPGWVHGSIHCKKYYHSIGTQKTAKTFVPDFSTAFHVYAVEWNKDLLTVSVDGNPFFSFANEHKGYEYWPFDNKMYLILNIAVGGNWGGQKGVDDGIFPVKMEVDYVRAYQK